MTAYRVDVTCPRCGTPVEHVTASAPWNIRETSRRRSSPQVAALFARTRAPHSITPKSLTP